MELSGNGTSYVEEAFHGGIFLGGGFFMEKKGKFSGILLETIRN
jgi:hypothetical protein